MMELGNNSFNAEEIYNSTYQNHEAYWRDWIEKNSILENPADGEVSDDGFGTLGRSLYDLVKVAVENEQYKMPFREFTEVKRVVKFRVRLSREEIHKIFKVKTYSIYGVGLFTLMDGIMLTSQMRDYTGYDTTGKHAYFDLSRVPSNLIEDYDFRLSIPALGGLFVPKKSPLTRWMDSTKQLQYFDIELDVIK